MAAAIALKARDNGIKLRAHLPMVCFLFFELLVVLVVLDGGGDDHDGDDDHGDDEGKKERQLYAQILQLNKVLLWR